MRIPLLIAGSPGGVYPLVKLHKGNWKIVCNKEDCDLLVSLSEVEHCVANAIIVGPRDIKLTTISKPCSVYAELQK